LTKGKVMVDGGRRMILRRLVCWLMAMVALAACSADPPPADNPVPVIVPGGPGEPAKTIPPSQATRMPVTPPNDNDFLFMRRMIVHHQQAIEMTSLAPSHAAADNVKRIASRISDSQRPEITVMNAWLKEHGQPTVDPGDHGQHTSHDGMPGMATDAQLDELRAATGQAFDSQFLRLMIAHHQGAVTMAQQAQVSAATFQVQEMADEVIAIQSDEINLMRGMLGG
jgi:uncharacterized protein (DUF305 family)